MSGGLRFRMLNYLANNWAQTDQRFKSWSPSDRYRFRAAKLEEMAEILRADEAFLIMVVVKQQCSLMKAADDLRLPYGLVEWLGKHADVLNRIIDSGESE